MKEKIVLSKNSPLSTLIEEIENSGTTVQVFRGEKVVARIIPNGKEVEDLLANEQYKTWGETLRSESVRI